MRWYFYRDFKGMVDAKLMGRLDLCFCFFVLFIMFVALIGIENYSAQIKNKLKTAKYQTKTFLVERVEHVVSASHLYQTQTFFLERVEYVAFFPHLYQT